MGTIMRNRRSRRIKNRTSRALRTAPVVVDSGPMPAWMARSRTVLFALCALLLSAQVTGAHLHLCFDGQEPPVQLHLLDAGEIHQDTGFSLPHSDEDIALSDGSSARAKPFHLDLPTLAVAMFLIPRPAVAFAAARRPALASHPAVRHELPPPPRGPPATSQA